MDEVIGLFPIPFLRAPATLPRPLVDALVAYFGARAVQGNTSSAKLSHTEVLQPGHSPMLVDVAALVTPKLAEFGALLFGERLGWSIKELWVNVLEHGGHQAMHNHANSFASGVVYLTPTHPASQTV
ncbi:MAG: putative 2OG-Fe(II) oxygenase, partial [Caldimonas sp.]